MSDTFHPYPLIQVLKVIALAIVAFLLLNYLRGLFSTLPNYLELIVLVLLLVRITLDIIFAYSHEIELADTGVIYTYGVLSKRKFVLPYSKITESGFNQNLFERLFDVGTLRVDTPGGTSDPINLANVRSKDAQTVLDRISAANK